MKKHWEINGLSLSDNWKNIKNGDKQTGFALQEAESSGGNLCVSVEMKKKDERVHALKSSFQRKRQKDIT